MKIRIILSILLLSIFAICTVGCKSREELIAQSMEELNKSRIKKTDYDKQEEQDKLELEELEGISKKKISKVYNVVNIVNGKLGDNSFYDSAYAGLSKLENSGRIILKNIELGKDYNDKSYLDDVFMEFASTRKYDVIICGTYETVEYLKDAAKEYPEQKFIIYDAQVDEPNVCSINYKQNDLGYLVGIMAGELTKCDDVERINDDNAIGFIGGVESSVINDFLYGFLVGAKKINPSIKVDTRYLKGYDDIDGARQSALSMIKDNNVDVIWGVAGFAGNGIVEAVKQSDKAWFVGVDSDQELTLNNRLAKYTITSGLKDIGNSLIWVFDELDLGKEHYGEKVLLGILEGGIGLVKDKNYSRFVPDEVKKMVEKAQNDVVTGRTNIPSTMYKTDYRVPYESLEKLRDKLQP